MSLTCSCNISIMSAPDSRSSNISKEQKMGFVFLLVFGVLAVSLGVLQMRNTIYSPFVVRATKDASLDSVLDETTRLQQIDTDRDGLSDYDELYFHNTSPYIEDTDSDGVEDKDEIDAGTDPLCPTGQHCEQDLPVEESVDLGEDELVSPQDILEQAQGALPGSPEIDPGAFLEQLQNPNMLRQVLLSTGRVTEEQLADFSDDELSILLEEFLLNNDGAAQ